MAPPFCSTSLRKYLEKYESGYEEENKKKKAKPDVIGVIIVDEDPVWQNPVKIDEEEDDPADEEKPLVVKDIEVKCMKKLEQLRAKRPFGAISEDGSGLVSVSDAPKNLNSDVQNLDMSPPCKDLSPPRKLRPEMPVINQRPRPKTGLVTGKDVKDEIAKMKKEEWLRFKDMDPLVSGRGAEPVYRNKVTGERLSKEEHLKSQKKKEKEKPKEIKLEWGKGLAQKREMKAKLKELESEKDKPFARSRDDPELDNMLKERLRWGDPMAHLVKKRKVEHVLPDLGADDKMKESDFIIPQEIPPHSWIRRGLDAAPNRYGIKPGRHWDGVDRSNATFGLGATAGMFFQEKDIMLFL